MLPQTLHGFRIVNKLDQGSFGELYKVKSLANNYEYIMKVERRNAIIPQLRYEAKIYKFLHEDKDAFDNGIPRFLTFFEKSNWNCLVFEMLGNSVDVLFEKANKEFSLKTVLMLAEEMITKVEYLHSRGIVHRDIKPGNFVIGKGKGEKKLFILDFGVSKKFVSKALSHIPFSKGKCLVGTARFSSINAHKGFEQSRRDDLESLGYSLVYLAKGTLPWIGIQCETKAEKYEALLQSKEASISGFLCNGLPKEFQQYFDYVLSLDFQQIPEYGFLRKLFRQVMFRNDFKFDKQFDWTEEAIRERGMMSANYYSSLLPSSSHTLGMNSAFIPKSKTKNPIRFEEKFEDETKEKPNFFMRLVSVFIQKLISNSIEKRQLELSRGLKSQLNSMSFLPPIKSKTNLHSLSNF